jgi:hypothetical protein
MKIKIIIICASIALLCTLLNFQKQEKIVNQKQEWHDHEKTVSYTVGFQRGYLAFVKQFGSQFDENTFLADLESFKIDSKIEKYTSLLEEDSESSEEANGYTDGYHFAADRAMKSNCPRCTRK